MAKWGNMYVQCILRAYMLESLRSLKMTPKFKYSFSTQSLRYPSATSSLVWLLPSANSPVSVLT